MKIKICGLTNPSDIKAVNSAKPNYIGFVFAESKRKVTLKQAKELKELLSPDILSVGVFVDEVIENIIAVINNGIIDIIQLHGAEDEVYIQKLKRQTNKPIIKAISVSSNTAIKKCHPLPDYLLLDHKAGGTGQTFNWGLISETSKPYFLAGGLNADNVKQIKEIKFQPFAVDVSSGVETNGKKDPLKIQQFVRCVRNDN